MTNIESIKESKARIKRDMSECPKRAKMKMIRLKNELTELEGHEKIHTLRDDMHRDPEIAEICFIKADFGHQLNALEQKMIERLKDQIAAQKDMEFPWGDFGNMIKEWREDDETHFRLVRHPAQEPNEHHDGIEAYEEKYIYFPDWYACEDGLVEDPIKAAYMGLKESEQEQLASYNPAKIAGVNAALGAQSRLDNKGRQGGDHYFHWGEVAEGFLSETTADLPRHLDPNVSSGKVTIIRKGGSSEGVEKKTEADLDHGAKAVAEAKALLVANKKKAKAAKKKDLAQRIETHNAIQAA